MKAVFHLISNSRLTCTTGQCSDGSNVLPKLRRWRQAVEVVPVDGSSPHLCLKVIAQPDDRSLIFGFVDTQMTKKYSTAMCYCVWSRTQAAKILKNYRSLYGSLPPEICKGDDLPLILTGPSPNADAHRGGVGFHLQSILMLVWKSWMAPIPFLQLASRRFAKSSWEMADHKKKYFSPQLSWVELSATCRSLVRHSRRRSQRAPSCHTWKLGHRSAWSHHLPTGKIKN